MNIQEVIEKIRKLRALSKSTNLNEAQNAAAIAEKLIAEYRVEEAELSAEKHISEPLIEAQSFLYQTGKVVSWKVKLAHRLSIHYGVCIWNNRDYSSGRKQTRYVMCGRESDIVILQYQFDFLVETITRLAGYCCFNDKRGVSVERNSFCEGAVDGFMDRLESEKKAKEQTASSTAMVLLNNKLREAKEYAYQKHNLRTAHNKSYAQKDHDAYTRGKDVGSKIQVNAGLNVGSKGKLLGG